MRKTGPPMGPFFIYSPSDRRILFLRQENRRDGLIGQILLSVGFEPVGTYA